MGALHRLAAQGARPRKYAGRFDRADIPDLPAVALEDEGWRLHHAQLICKPFKRLLRVVFVLDIDADPEEARPVTLFATDPEMAPERIHRIYRDRFRIEFNFRDAKQHLGLAACQARTADRHHFHVNAVLAALGLDPARTAPGRRPGPGPAFRHGRAGPHPAKIPAGPAGPPGSGPNRAATALNPRRIRSGCAVTTPIPASATPA